MAFSTSPINTYYYSIVKKIQICPLETKLANIEIKLFKNQSAELKTSITCLVLLSIKEFTYKGIYKTAKQCNG